MERAIPRSIAATHGRSPLRILHVLSSLQVGGMEKFAVRMAAEQCRAGHLAEIMTMHDGPLTAEAREAGINVRLVNGHRSIARAFHTLVQVARARPQIIHVHNESSLQYGVLGRYLSGARVVMTFHGQGGGCYREPSARELRATSAVIAVSRASAETLERKEFGSRLEVIYNGVAPSRGSNRERIRNEFNLDSSVVGVIVARMDGLKGHDTLIEALAMQPPDSPVRVLALGDGPARSGLEALARERNLAPERIQFLGFRKDVPDLLAAADWFVLPSLAEGLPLSLLEAMSHGLPVVVTEVGGMPEVVDVRHGYLVPPGDAIALAAAITSLGGDADNRARLGENARLRAEEFSLTRMLDQYEALYTRVLNERNQ